MKENNCLGYSETQNGSLKFPSENRPPNLKSTTSNKAGDVLEPNCLLL